MTWSDTSALDELAGVYVVANTPTYLFDRLRGHAAVLGLAESVDTRALLDFVQRVAHQSERRETDVAKAYAALVAVSFRPYPEWREDLKSIDLAALKWGESFRDIMTARAVTTAVSQHAAPSTLPPLWSRPSGSTGTVELSAGRPTIEVER
jgi:hypothetical protein